MDPGQRRDDIVTAGVAGVCVFLAVLRKVKVAKDIQPVVYGNHDHIAQPCHIRAVVGHLLNG